jgi:hypothetical protein
MPPEYDHLIPTGLPWPELPFDGWKKTNATLHMWLQIVGKIRLTRSPWVNQQWHSTLHLTSRGLTTMAIPHDGRSLQLDFDFIDHALEISTSDGGRADLELRPRSVADFYRTLMEELDGLGVPVAIHGSPNEVVDPIPFAENERDGEYDAEYVHRFFQALSSAATVFGEFRARFTGKCSPVHFFWGAMDLAVTRFSGRRAPVHPGGIPNLPDWVTREAYSHEVSSAGFWAGGESHPQPIFYSYAYPNPEGFEAHDAEPEAARWEKDLSEFILPYEAVRTSETPEADLMAFLESTYEAAAELAGWDRDRLEWRTGERPSRSDPSSGEGGPRGATPTT